MPGTGDRGAPRQSRVAAAAQIARAKDLIVTDMQFRPRVLVPLGLFATGLGVLLAGCGGSKDPLPGTLAQGASDAASLAFVLDRWAGGRIPDAYARIATHDGARALAGDTRRVTEAGKAPAPERSAAGGTLRQLEALAGDGAHAIERSDHAGAARASRAISVLAARLRDAARAAGASGV